MTLIDAIQDGFEVAVIFVSAEQGRQWSITFTEMTPLAQFISSMVGQLVKNENVNKKRPFAYYKTLFVSEQPPEEEEEEPVMFVAKA